MAEKLAKGEGSTKWKRKRHLDTNLFEEAGTTRPKRRRTDRDETSSENASDSENGSESASDSENGRESASDSENGSESASESLNVRESTSESEEDSEETLLPAHMRVDMKRLLMSSKVRVRPTSKVRVKPRGAGLSASEGTPCEDGEEVRHRIIVNPQVIKNIENVAGCRDTRTAKSKETRGMIEHNSEVYNPPYRDLLPYMHVK